MNEVGKRPANKAYVLHAEILQRTVSAVANFLKLGWLFKTIRDERLYEFLDAGSFDEYLGFPEIGFSRPSVYNFIRIQELYIDKLKVQPEFLGQPGLYSKLITIAPVVEQSPDEWLYKAKELSRSDLKKEIRAFKNLPEIEIKQEKDDVQIYDFKNYLDFVKAHPCVICSRDGVDPAHFPRSKGAGGDDKHCIPLCRTCHSQSHQDPFDFLWQHKDKIFKYFYDTFLKAFALFRMVSK